MKAVILAGGLGTRISEETGTKPKPMVEIGGKPILWHIMKIYGAHGINDFVICCGYKGYVIKEYFANYFLHMSDVTFDMRSNDMVVNRQYAEPWRVTLVDTGDNTLTGGRLKRVRPYLEGEGEFCFTYGDGVSDVDVTALIAFHRRHGKLATVTAVQPPGRYGALDLAGTDVRGFVEKPQGDGGWINGGYFVLSPAVIDLIEGDSTPWEAEPLRRLSQDGQLEAFQHAGFWQPMDTLRDKTALETLWGKRSRTVEDLELTGSLLSLLTGKRVLVTGHTGFKGSWLALLLEQLGCIVAGYALPPSSTPSLFELAQVESSVAAHTIADIRDGASLKSALQNFSPDLVLHLAAQPIVRRSYAAPAETWETNVVGTVNLLEAVRSCSSVRAVVVVTTDKVYENRGWAWGYREIDSLGGYDPYSASKAATELVVESYRRSFFSDSGVYVASARAGNVIGGGDWSRDRILADAARAVAAGRPLIVRNPSATRPWQHVLDCLAGYLTLSVTLLHGDGSAATAFNFGPDAADNVSVASLLDRLHKFWPELSWAQEGETLGHPHEAAYLYLDLSRARRELDWSPKWSLTTAAEKTANWYRLVADMPETARSVTIAQTKEFLDA